MSDKNYIRTGLEERTIVTSNHAGIATADNHELHPRLGQSTRLKLLDDALHVVLAHGTPEVADENLNRETVPSAHEPPNFAAEERDRTYDDRHLIFKQFAKRHFMPFFIPNRNQRSFVDVSHGQHPVGFERGRREVRGDGRNLAGVDGWGRNIGGWRRRGRKRKLLILSRVFTPHR